MSEPPPTPRTPRRREPPEPIQDQPSRWRRNAEARLAAALARRQEEEARLARRDARIVAERLAAAKPRIARFAEPPPPEEPTAPPPEAETPAAAPTFAPSRLKASGAFLVTDDGDAVTLRGVGLEGLEAGWPAASARTVLGLDDANLNVLGDLWGVNLIRVTLSTVGLGELDASSLDAALTDLEDLAGAVLEAGAYLLLAMQAAPATAPGPAGAAVASPWSALAGRFSSSPSVLFEILRDPAASGPWADAAFTMIGEIRLNHPGAVIFVGEGPGVALADLPLTFTDQQPVPNIVYAPTVPAGRSLTPDEEAAIARLARLAPVAVTVWPGFEGVDDTRVGEAVGGALGRIGLGWSAASWNTPPRLVADAAGHDFRPTRWGSTVQRAMAFPPKTPLVPLLPGEP
jgi:hypothetical protein